jgi:hypothetical protein
MIDLIFLAVTSGLVNLEFRAELPGPGSYQYPPELKQELQAGKCQQIAWVLDNIEYYSPSYLCSLNTTGWTVPIPTVTADKFILYIGDEPNKPLPPILQ